MRVTPELKNCDNCLVRVPFPVVLFAVIPGQFITLASRELQRKEVYPRVGKLTLSNIYAPSRVFTLATPQIVAGAVVKQMPGSWRGPGPHFSRMRVISAICSSNALCMLYLQQV